ncbi:MAG TPA: class I tRNA ligase family protein, partial [Candidatus Dojkabacteria bacterium]|nr:class I tRNA ligase family protein [Candidatus Dojkabacteria bacterium]
SMKDLRYDMMSVTKQINWIPSFGMDRELEWLENMHDWCISKKRYWGLALPIWVCKDCGNFEVIGSQKELKERAIEGWDKFEGHTPHRPYVDEIKIKCSKCGGVSERVKDVGNPWLDAGIVPFSTLNYTTNNDNWKKWYPTDFVCECFPGQFKNWFYSLIAMSTVLENKSPFKNLLGHEVVKDEHGEEMHKSKGNSIAFDEAANKAGADVLRWAYVKQNPTNQMLFGFKLTEDYKKNFYLILWNIYKYFITYADLANFEPTKNDIRELELTILDKWLLSRLNTLIKTTDEYMLKYDHTVVTKALEEFILELSTWYIRRSRDRFADLDNVALNMLYYTLKRVIILLSIFMPFISEEMYQNIVKSVDSESKESVHLEDFPLFDEKSIDSKMEEQMQSIKQLSSLGQSIRVSNALKIRQPLSEIQIKGVKLDQEYLDILLNELNIKKCSIVENLPEGDNWKSADDNFISIAIDANLTDELKAEGFLREFIRSIQNERKKNGLIVGESVYVHAKGFDESQKKIISENIESIKSQVYASEVDLTDNNEEKTNVDNIKVVTITNNLANKYE